MKVGSRARDHKGRACGGTLKKVSPLNSLSNQPNKSQNGVHSKMTRSMAINDILTLSKQLEIYFCWDLDTARRNMTPKQTQRSTQTAAGFGQLCQHTTAKRPNHTRMSLPTTAAKTLSPLRNTHPKICQVAGSPPTSTPFPEGPFKSQMERTLMIGFNWTKS